MMQEDPALIACALSTLERWERMESKPHPSFVEWRRILLERDWDAALSTSELGNQIRQSSPVGCVLPEEKRLAIMRQCRREHLKSVVPITQFPRGKRVLLKDIPIPYREQFQTDTQGQTFEMIDGDLAYFPPDWESWLRRRFPL